MISVFIVDDHALIRIGTKTFLEKQVGVVTVVGEAENGVELFEQLSEMSQLPDVLLLDIVMPQMSGIEAVKKLKKEYPNIKVLMLSAETSMNTISELLDLQIDGFISKSAPYNELLGAILSVARGVEYFGKDIATLIDEINIIKGNMESLTDREKEVMHYVASGMSVKEISEQIHIASRTVETHKNNIFRKMGFKSSFDMILFALRYGIISL